ncbi:hypothetical protein BG262_01695 [Floricoccus penangensis]|uniref:DUF2812 domain-containing protein n=1 Tax=Floricoccus penangensis TaxID=1859475 RepID=A0A9Q5JGN0_9LACT|nr:DUF2812 domain-containing protein [Floricoccus penangensis]OFI47067.1 hypothetical protein BG262_01695 [Floricoccus penangensis]
MEKTVYIKSNDFVKEEEYLNNLAKEGWRLKRISSTKYYLSDCQPDRYQYKIYFTDRNQKETKKYIDFLKEMNIRYIGRNSEKLYLEKEASDGDFDLFSDNVSKTNYLNRVEKYLWSSFLAFSCIMLFTFIPAIKEFPAWTITRKLLFSFGFLAISILVIMQLSRIYKIHKSKKEIEKEQIISE